MPKCGSQVILCDLPIRFDTYQGCSHGCKYCFSNRKIDIKNIKVFEKKDSLINFINHKRNSETAWCDWDIPLHWGGMSDPFQPIEKEYRNSFECLKVLAETKYPFVVSTKGILLMEDDYFNLFKNANGVLQVSLCCEKYDELEPFAPKFKERLKLVEKISKINKRVVIRIQPYIINFHKQILNSLNLFQKAGAYGVIVEGIKLFKKVDGFVKLGGDYVYPLEVLKPRFIELKDVAHSLGLKFYSGENRLRYMGDSLTCCGIDGLEGFKHNNYNLNHYLFDKDNYKETDAMKIQGRGVYCFKALSQDTVSTRFFKTKSFKEIMDIYTKDKKTLEIYGL
jgi:DNA repair photolyase